MDEKSIDEQIQETEDWWTACAHAATTAERTYRGIFSRVVKRGIDNKANAHIPNKVEFNPTDEERKVMLESYLEWQAYKKMWEEKQKEYLYISTHKKPYSYDIRLDESINEGRFKVLVIVAKGVFVVSMFLASVLIINEYLL